MKLKTWVRKSLSVGVLAAGALLIAQAPAQADFGDTLLVTSDNFGTGNGTQAFAPVTTVTNTCGVGAIPTGLAFIDCSGGASVGGDGDDGWDQWSGHGKQNHHYSADESSKSKDKKSPKGDYHGGDSKGYDNADWKDHGKKGDQPGHDDRDGRDGGWHDTATTLITSGNFGTLNGTQVFAPITTVINLCGAAVAPIGAAIVDCSGGASADGGSGGPVLFTGNNFGTGNGTQTFAPVTTVTNTCGDGAVPTGLAVVDCSGGAQVESGREESGRGEGSRPGPVLISSDNFGDANGTQTFTPVTTVTNTCGDVAAPIGAAFVDCSGGASVNGWGGPVLVTKDNFGTGNGTQLFAPVTTVANTCGAGLIPTGLAIVDCGGGAAVESALDSESAIAPRQEAIPVVGNLMPMLGGLPLVGSLPVVNSLTNPSPAMDPAALTKSSAGQKNKAHKSKAHKGQGQATASGVGAATLR